MRAALPRRARPLTVLRAKRTRATNCVLASIEWMLTQQAKWAIGGEPVGADFVGLPSWWPFWSDVLKTNVIEAVRVARELEKMEGGTNG